MTSTRDARAAGTTRHWHYAETVKEEEWIDATRLLIASETALFLFDIETGAREPVCDLERQNTATRSNDGRADPWGGFWIGNMGTSAEPGAGAI